MNPGICKLYRKNRRCQVYCIYAISRLHLLDKPVTSQLQVARKLDISLSAAYDLLASFELNMGKQL